MASPPRRQTLRLPEELEENARVGVRVNTAGSTFLRRRVNHVAGTAITLTLTDDGSNEEAIVTTAVSLGTGATQAAAGNDARLSDARTPTGTAAGDLTGTYPSPTLAVDRIPKNVGTTKGDLLAYTASATPARLPVGTDAHVLQPDSTQAIGVKWGQVTTAGIAAVPQCRIYNSANITITDNLNTYLTFNTERFDTDTMHSTVTNTGRITFTTAGTYLVGANIIWAANGSGTRVVGLRLNGTTFIALADQSPTGALVVTRQQVNTVYAFVATDYVEVLAYQSSGGNLDVSASGNVSPEAWATRLSA